MDKKGVGLALHLGAGKIHPMPKGDRYTHHILVDHMYESGHPVFKIEEIIDGRTSMEVRTPNLRDLFCTSDVLYFLENFKYTANHITIHRFLEHVSRDKLLYFIYQLSQAIHVGDNIDIIVPNYRTLAELIIEEPFILKEDVGLFQGHDIALTTELLNEPDDPHASIWTPDRAYYYFHMEGRFNITDMQEEIEYDGRNWYMRFTATRVK